jgi:hypothetical protein
VRRRESDLVAGEGSTAFSGYPIKFIISLCFGARKRQTPFSMKGRIPMANNPPTSPNQGTPVAKPVQRRGAAMMGRGAVLAGLGLVLTFVFNAISGATGFTVAFTGAIVFGSILFIIGLLRWLVGR